MKYPGQIYIYVYVYIYIYIYKASNLIKRISSHNMCPEIKSQQVKKKHLSFNTKNF